MAAATQFKAQLLGYFEIELFVCRRERTIVCYRNVCAPQCVFWQKYNQALAWTHTQFLKESLCHVGIHNDSITACQTSYETDSTQPKLISLLSFLPLSISPDNSTLYQSLSSQLSYKKKATMCFPGPTKRKTSTGINRGCKREESIVRTPYWVKIQLLIQSYSDCPSLKAPWSFWPAGSATSEKLYSLVENLLIWRVVIIPRNIYSLHQRLQIKCHCVWNLASRPYWQGVVDIQKDAVECKRISVCETVNVYMHV